MTAGEIACRTCSAQPGEPCVYRDYATGEPIVTPSSQYHAARIEDAAYWSGGGNVSKEAFDKAVAGDLYGG